MKNLKTAYTSLEKSPPSLAALSQGLNNVVDGLQVQQVLARIRKRKSKLSLVARRASETLKFVFFTIFKYIWFA